MPKMSNRGAVLARGTGASLVAAIACASANGALAARPQPQRIEGARELSARVEALAERLRSADPTLHHKLPPAARIAQWRNR